MADFLAQGLLERPDAVDVNRLENMDHLWRKRQHFDIVPVDVLQRLASTARLAVIDHKHRGIIPDAYREFRPKD
jgi:hypothetical protein